jgi:hypothetical protein
MAQARITQVVLDVQLHSIWIDSDAAEVRQAPHLSPLLIVILRYKTKTIHPGFNPDGWN